MASSSFSSLIIVIFEKPQHVFNPGVKVFRGFGTFLFKALLIYIARTGAFTTMFFEKNTQN
jgi:hypothetical protein